MLPDAIPCNQEWRNIQWHGSWSDNDNSVVPQHFATWDVHVISDEYRVTFCDCEGDVFSSSSGERNSCLVSSNPILSLNCLPADTDICQWGFWTKILKEYFPSETILDNILILLWCFHFVRERVSYLVGNKLIYPRRCSLSRKRSVVSLCNLVEWHSDKNEVKEEKSGRYLELQHGDWGQHKWILAGYKEG